MFDKVLNTPLKLSEVISEGKKIGNGLLFLLKNDS